ncbi:lipoprotein, partial [Salmonella enterica]|nr:lipoprotein [Salmonella enterica subsp. enterica serovar Schwarzengrund]EJC3864808.1 lipoprotein [Salmonella enterica]EJN1768251.1 lipoprotein [Salmonella enterica]EJP0635819.1 lipoprotein [Salmonella enterica subsp. enterica serovar Schwarzengrund]EMC5486092.1 lipoprotein [Salmonella enterica]
MPRLLILVAVLLLSGC